ncbi:MAG: hypothetical protein K8R21_10665 [Leptospira sp.]|nr:hypothetical protein [Leptospira sp.]
MAYILYGSILTYLIVLIFGEVERKYSILLSIIIASLIPPMLLGAMMNIVTTWYSSILIAKTDVFYSIYGYMIVILVIAELIWSGIIFVIASKIVIKQNTGRAVVTWLFPVFLFLLAVYLMENAA